MLFYLGLGTGIIPTIKDKLDVPLLKGVHGRPPPVLTRFIPGEMAVEVVAQELQTRDETLKQLRYHLTKAQDQMAKYANRKQRPVEIKVGDWVYLKIRPHRQSTMST